MLLPHDLRPYAFAQRTRLDCMVRKLRKYSLLLESPESGSPQKLFANICGQSDFRLCTCDICNRLAPASVYWGCQKGVDVARLRPVEYDCHAGDLSALVDLVSHGCVEVGTCGKESVKVGHHAVLVMEGRGPLAAGVRFTSHDLALVFDAFGQAGSISRQKAEACGCVVLPKGAHDGAVSGNALPNNLALVVNGVGHGARSSEVRKLGDSAVVPHYGVRKGAGSRIACSLALIVDAVRHPVWIATECRKRLGFALFPQSRQVNPIIRIARRACRVHHTVFRKSCDFSALIDRAGLPVISAQ